MLKYTSLFTCPLAVMLNSGTKKLILLFSVGLSLLFPSEIPLTMVEKPMSAKVSWSMFNLQAWAGEVATPISAAMAKRLFLMLIPSFKGFLNGFNDSIRKKICQEFFLNANLQLGVWKLCFCGVLTLGSFFAILQCALFGVG
jgi:hypothetical protein